MIFIFLVVFAVLDKGLTQNTNETAVSVAPTFLETIQQLIAVLFAGLNNNDTVYEFNTDTEFSLVDLGLPPVNIEFEFRPIDEVTTTTLEPNVTTTTTEQTTTTTEQTTTTTELTTTTTELTTTTTELTTTTTELTTTATEPITTTVTAKPNCSIEDFEKATAIIGGCDNQKSIRLTEVFSAGVNITLPDNPTRSCAKGAAVFYQEKVVYCGGDSVNITECYSSALGGSVWEDFPNIPEHRERFAMAATTDYIAVIGGFKSAGNCMVLSNNAWSMGPMLNASKGLIHHDAVGLDNNLVLVIGGFQDFTPTDKTFFLDLNKNEVTEGPVLMKPRYAHSATVFNMMGAKYVAVAGGFIDYAITDYVEVLKYCGEGGVILDGGDFRQLAPMKVKRFDFGLGVLGKSLAAFGGEPTIISDQIETYDPATQSWHLTNNFVSVKGRHYFATVTSPS